MPPAAQGTEEVVSQLHGVDLDLLYTDRSLDARGFKAMGDQILVTGATGQQGGAVARALLRRGVKVRALVRDTKKANALELQRQGAELAIGSFDDQESLRKAMTGMYGVFSVQNFFEGGFDKEVEQGKAIADIAKKCNVQHLVYGSVIGADRKSNIPHFESKWQIEQHIKGLGIKHTILRLVSYMDNLLNFNMYSDGRLFLPIRPTTQWQLVATKDIGELAAIAFSKPESVGDILELAGDQLTPSQMAEVFSRVFGLPVQYKEQPMDEVRAYNQELALMFEWFNERANFADIGAVRKIHPQLLNLEQWLRQSEIAAPQLSRK
jgi:uncharacterized protein YbjT (DUF2867 family)